VTAPAAELKRTSVGIGQLAVAGDAGALLIAYGLGSCVGVSVYDAQARVGALAHILLPDADGKARDAREPARYADTGIEALIEALLSAGAFKRRLVVKLAGGAAVLGPANAEKFKIGERNAEAIRDRLKRHGLAPVAADIGGTRGRTLELHLSTGKTYVRTAASPASEL